MIAIDLGSNSLRILAYDCTNQVEIYGVMATVKTADGLVKYGSVSKEAIDRIVCAINEAKEKIDFSSHEIRAVTTEALRQANNVQEVLLSIEKQTGISFDVISADEEARLTLFAVSNRLKKLHCRTDSLVLVDIGGGSTEITFEYQNERISKSFPIGIVTISQQYDTLENIEKALSSRMLSMQMFCTKMAATKGKPQTFVATAGTPTTIAAMKLGFDYASYDAKKINGTLLTYDELDIYLQKLLRMTDKERAITVGTGRSDLIMAGILIFKELYKMLDFDKCVVVDDGLREGVALDYCKRQLNT